MTDWPKITARRIINVSPWMQVIEREVEIGARDLIKKERKETRILIRAAEPNFTTRSVSRITPLSSRARRVNRNSDRTTISPGPRALHLANCRPAMDEGEAPEVCCRRELLEETGFTAQRAGMLGSYAVETVHRAASARLSNRIHSFFVETGPRSDRPATEPGMELKLVAPEELGALILAGECILAPCYSQACAVISISPCCDEVCASPSAQPIRRWVARRQQRC